MTAAYIHYKLYNPSLKVYDANGVHQTHFHGAGAPHVGIGMHVANVEDMFREKWHDEFPLVERFEGCISNLAPLAAASKHPWFDEKFRVARRLPVYAGPGSCRK